jgi:hypothetical protein
MLTAVPAGIVAWVLVRRGYILAPISADCSIGALAGLMGLFAPVPVVHVLVQSNQFDTGERLRAVQFFQKEVGSWTARTPFRSEATRRTNGELLSA